MKLALRSYESTLWIYEALNAPKTHVGVLARLKAQNLPFSAENSRIFDFQILKMARLKALSTRCVLTCAISSMDPKVTSSMISKHSDASRPKNAPFCEEQWLLYLLKIHQNDMFWNKWQTLFFSLQNNPSWMLAWCLRCV